MKNGKLNEMKVKKILAVLICIALTAAVLAVCFFMPDFTDPSENPRENYVIDSEKTVFKGTDIKGALGVAAKSEIYVSEDLSLTAMTKEEAEDACKKELSILAGEDTLSRLDFISADHFVPRSDEFYSMWWCLYRSFDSGNEVIVIFDEGSGKIMSIQSDINVNLIGHSESYDNYPDLRYFDDEELLNLAYSRAEFMASLFSGYYGLTMGEVSKEYRTADRYTFSAELIDKNGDSAKIRCSYNVSTGMMNWNFS